jgi:hypothetical protein
MWKIIEGYVLLICQYAIYSFVMTAAWNEICKNVMWLQIEWSQTLSGLVLTYMLTIFFKSYYSMFVTSHGSKK